MRTMFGRQPLTISMMIRKRWNKGEEGVGRRWTKGVNEVSGRCKMMNVCDVMELRVMIRFVK